MPAPGTPQPHNEGYDSANDMIHLDSPASPDPLDDTLASHPLDSDSDRDVSHIAHETSSEDNDAVDLTGLRLCRVHRGTHRLRVLPRLARRLLRGTRTAS